MNTKIKVLEENLPKKSCAYCKHLSLVGPSENFTYDVKCVILNESPLGEKLCEHFESESTQITSSDLDTLYINFLESLHKIDYSTYLDTIHWKKFKEKVFCPFDDECTICVSNNNLDVYHVNDNFGRETFDDVDVLCNNCLNK